MKKLVLAYCAGVVDSDGCITIKKRRFKAKYVIYSAAVFVRQVERGAVELLHSTFGGHIREHPPSTPGGRPLHQWEVSNRKAAATAKLLLPFLRIKHEQARILIEFGEHMADYRLRHRVHWFKWQKGEPTYTTREAAEMKGISVSSVHQMVCNGTLPVRRKGRKVLIAKRFWDTYQSGNAGHPLPPEYVALREEICQRIRRLNGPTRGVPTASR